MIYCCLFFSSSRRHTRCALVTGVQTCALPIYVERARHIGRRNHDSERLRIGPFGPERAGAFPMRIPARLDGGGVEGLVELASVVGHDAAALSRTCPSGKAVQSAPACSASIGSPGAEGSTIMVPSSCFSPIRRGAAPLLSNMSP